MPTLCRPVAEGGIGFDYRLSMGPPVSIPATGQCHQADPTRHCDCTHWLCCWVCCLQSAICKLCNWTSVAASWGNQLLPHLKPHRLCTQDA